MVELDATDTETTCRAFGLGAALTPLVAVEGGLSHRVGKPRTHAGTFAIKQLNPAATARPRALDRYRVVHRGPAPSAWARGASLRDHVRRTAAAPASR